MGITDTLPIYHTTDYGLLEGNPCSSDTKDELITTFPSTSSMKGERVPSTPNSCSATNCETRILSAKAMLEAETAPTPNLLQNQLSTSPMDSVCNSFPWNMFPLSISKLLPELLKESIEPCFAKHGLQDFNLVDPPLFITWLPGGSTKTRPPGHRRGRPPRTSSEHSWQTVLLSVHDGRCSGCPPRSALETLLPWSHQPKGHRRGRPPIYYLRSCPRPTLSFCILHVGHYLLSNSCYPHIKEGVQRLRPEESTKARGASVEKKHPYILQLNWTTPGGYHCLW